MGPTVQGIMHRPHALVRCCGRQKQNPTPNSGETSVPQEPITWAGDRKGRSPTDDIDKHDNEILGGLS